MRILCNAKISAIICKLRFVLCFTYVNAIAKNPQIRNKQHNVNVSKPLHLCIKLACRFLKAHSWNMTIVELAEAFMQQQGFRSRKVKKVLHLSAKVSIGNRPERFTGGAEKSSHEGVRSKVRYIFIRNKIQVDSPRGRVYRITTHPPTHNIAQQ